MKESQVIRIWDYLVANGSITPLEAMNLFGVMRLAAVIHVIRHRFGIDIKTEMIEVKNRFGETARVARYRMA